jgi:hypothetical protein
MPSLGGSETVAGKQKALLFRFVITRADVQPRKPL